MERVQAPQSTGESAVVPSLPSVGELERAPPPLDHLALSARTTPGQPGRDALGSLHRALAALPPTEASAALLLQLLDEGAFNELRADDGTATRELAIETLLRLGYPWALKIHPDELAWYRVTRLTRRRNRALILLMVLVAGGLAAAFLLGAF